MEYIILLLCIVAILVIMTNIYLIIEFYKEVKRAKKLNDMHEEAVEQFIFKNELRRNIMKVQELIEKLEHDNKVDNIAVKKLEEKRRQTTSEYYKNSYQMQIHKLNAKIEIRKEILKDMKGEE